ncbi:nSTAND1 domain-containing NTPase [Streptomyces parvulus]|uniref:nSTAND1 domain-containing NTPase n=1 Tax=Streptomyces parvulus TaxID=146923 RepID=UPI0033B57D4A
MPSESPLSPQDFARRRLVCIAVREYPDEAQWFKDTIDRQVEKVESWFTNKSIASGMRFDVLKPEILETKQDIRAFAENERLYEYGPDDVMVVYITGHGMRGMANRHFLLLPKSDESKLLSTAFPTAELVGAILDSEAEHVLILVDSCFAGTLDIELASHLQDLSSARRTMDTLAVVTSGDFADQPRVGEFTEVIQLALDRISDESSGFANPNISFQEWEYILRDIARDRRDLISVNWVWPRSRNSTPTPCLPNLGYWSRQPSHGVSAALTPAVTDFRRTPPSYWITRASGSTGDNDSAWYFTGRQQLVESVKKFLNTGEGVCVVTGEAGSGKSAILAQIVVHGHKRVRDEARALVPPELSSSDFPEIDVAVLARNKNSAAVAAEIREAVRELIGDDVKSHPSTLEDLVHFVQDNLQRQMSIVIDGVDEAVDPEGIVSDLLVPLMRRASGERQNVRVLLGVRSPRSSSSLNEEGNTKSLVENLTLAINERPRRSISTLDANEAPTSDETEVGDIANWDEVSTLILRSDGNESASDIENYARALLLDGQHEGSPYTKNESAAREVAAIIAERVAPSFLNAQLAADGARKAPAIQDVQDEKWLATLQDGTVSLLYSDVEEVAENSGIPSTDLLAGLQATAFSCGEGLPWSDVWPAVYKAIHPHPVHDVEGVLKALRSSRLSGYMATYVSDERLVYRPGHERITEELKQETLRSFFGEQGNQTSADQMVAIHAIITTALGDLVRRNLPYAPHPYIRRYLIEHAVRGEVLDDSHIPIAFLEWETSRLVGSYLRTQIPLSKNRSLHAWSRLERHLDGIDIVSQRGSHAFHLTALGGSPPPLAGWIHSEWVSWRSSTAMQRAEEDFKGLSTVAAVGRYVFATSQAWPGTVEVRNSFNGKCESRVPTGPIASICAFMTNEGEYVATYPLYMPGTVADRRIEIWEPTRGLKTGSISSGRIRQLRSLNWGDPRIAAICERFSEEVAVWNPESGELLHRLHGVAAGSFCDLGIMGSGESLIAVSDRPSKNARVHIWSPGESRVLNSFATGPIGAMAKVCDGTGQVMLATTASPYGSSDIKIFDVKSGDCYRKLQVGTVRAMTTASSGNGREFLIVAGTNSVLSLFDLWSGHEMEKLVTDAPAASLFSCTVKDGSKPRILVSGAAGVAALTLGRGL